LSGRRLRRRVHWCLRDDLEVLLHANDHHDLDNDGEALVHACTGASATDSRSGRTPTTHHDLDNDGEALVNVGPNAPR
jgi:hypothetical protein